MPLVDAYDHLLLAGAREIRRARSAADAERELARGFRPRVVLLELGADARRTEALAKRMASHPACAAVPIVGVSGDADRLHLTLLNGAAALSTPSQLADLIRVIEDLGLDLIATSAAEPALAC